MNRNFSELMGNDAVAAALANWLAKTSADRRERNAAYEVKNARLSRVLGQSAEGELGLDYHRMPTGGYSLLIRVSDGDGGLLTFHSFVNLLTMAARERVVGRIGWPPSHRLVLQTA
jgi:hypothetical protein